MNIHKSIITKGHFLLYLVLLVHCNANSQEVLNLYEEIPNSKNVDNEETSTINDGKKLIIRNVTEPTLTIYLPKDNPSGTAVIICPGGGYVVLAAGHEGSDVAAALNSKGIAAFVLKYRLPSDKTMEDKSIGPLQDAQRAIQIVRSNAGKWKLDKDKIGILGFSAGGHLAATASTQFNNVVIDNPQNVNLRPDFSVLIYPVISSDTTFGHISSFDNLVGKNASQSALTMFSAEEKVTAETPPAFMVHAKDDPVSIKNSYTYVAALEKNGIDYETKYFESGGHGFGLVNPQSEDRWVNDLVSWLKAISILD